jgi:hypothetical protein
MTHPPSPNCHSTTRLSRADPFIDDLGNTSPPHAQARSQASGVSSGRERPRAHGDSAVMNEIDKQDLHVPGQDRALTDTQRNILRALCRPLTEADLYAAPATNRQIGQEVFLGVDAVKAHLRALCPRFGSQSLAQYQSAPGWPPLEFPDGHVIPRGCADRLWVRWWSGIRSIGCSVCASRCCNLRREARGRVHVRDAGGGRNVKLDEAATDRGPGLAGRPLTFEVLVELAGVIAALDGGRENW